MTFSPIQYRRNYKMEDMIFTHPHSRNGSKALCKRRLNIYTAPKMSKHGVYSVQIQENTDQKKFLTWTLITQW